MHTFYFLLCLIALAGIYSVLLDTRGEKGYSSAFPAFGKKLFSLSIVWALVSIDIYYLFYFIFLSF